MATPPRHAWSEHPSRYLARMESAPKIGVAEVKRHGFQHKSVRGYRASQAFSRPMYANCWLIAVLGARHFSGTCPITSPGGLRSTHEARGVRGLFFARITSPQQSEHPSPQPISRGEREYAATFKKRLLPKSGRTPMVIPGGVLRTPKGAGRPSDCHSPLLGSAQKRGITKAALRMFLGGKRIADRLGKGRR